jgi:hypothetical protein
MRLHIVLGMICAVLAGIWNSRAQAVTFDIAGMDAGGQTISGTIAGDATLSTVTSVNLIESGAGNPFNLLFNNGFSGSVPLVTVTDAPEDAVLILYLSLPGGETIAQLNQLIQTNYSNAVANAQATYYPSQCNGDPTCISTILGDQAAAISNANTALDNSFAATATPLATPLPAALPLFATGLGALGLLGWRRRRKVANAA